MHVRRTLAGFFPTDPDYAPFGQPWLRGLNLPTLGLVALVGLMLGLFNMFHASSLAEEILPLGFYLAGIVRGPFRILLLFMPMLLLVTAADHLTARARPAFRIGALTTAMLLGALIQAFVAFPVICLIDSVLYAYEPEDPECTPSLVFTWGKAGIFWRAVGWGGLFTAVLYFYKRGRDAALALHRAQLRRLVAERQETDARLLSLQAQVEPHFLFNTLAHVQRLYEVQPERGRAMLRSLVAYLRSALPLIRSQQSTLGREMALVRAYANVQSLRMGDRLRVDIDVPDALADAAVPPLMVLTLVENAIKHGLSPKSTGGTVRIEARRSDEQLTVQVSDDGVGLKIGAGTGRGLANTQGRLLAAFGSKGRLEVVSGPSGGVCATLAMPSAPTPVGAF